MDPLFPYPSNSTGHYPQVSINYSTNDNDNINHTQSNYPRNDTSTRPGGNTIAQNVPAPPGYPSLPETLARILRLAPPTHNVIGMPQNTLMYSGGPNNNFSVWAPAQASGHTPITTLLTGVSHNYQGDPYLRANQSANIPDELNTSVWITNLPPNLNHKMLLDNVRNCGKIYAAVVNAPGNGHITAASKIVFFDVAGVQNLLRQFNAGDFRVEGYMPRVGYNRIKTEARLLGAASRVLNIEGPSCIVNQRFLAYLFQTYGIKWQDEVVIVLSNRDGITRLEWRFGSYRCQAESARHLIDRVKRLQPPIPEWQSVAVNFGVDPCAPRSSRWSLCWLCP
ncbi:hypothetical protein F5Y12DRAFT_668426 [Xylaria sp. FL1777]|nr:hypothetical protein F5Y12DRAFT_668426 [Xylaria sp. FL1777]